MEKAWPMFTGTRYYYRKCVESRSARLNCAPYGIAQKDDMGGVGDAAAVYDSTVRYSGTVSSSAAYCIL